MFIPTVTLAWEQVPGSLEDIARASHDLFHAALLKMVERLAEAAKHGVLVLCGDGKVRLCFQLWHAGLWTIQNNVSYVVFSLNNAPNAKFLPKTLA